MGYDRGHTTAMLKKTPETPEEVRTAEDLIRCAAIGNSFHVSTVSYLVGSMLSQMGLKQMRGVQEICQAHINRQAGSVVIKLEAEDEDDLPLDQLPGELEAVEMGERSDNEISRSGLAYMDQLEEDCLYVPSVEQMKEHDVTLSTRIAAAFIRRQEFRGSDVRLDLGSL